MLIQRYRCRKVKILDALFNNIAGEGLVDEALASSRAYIAEHKDSVSAEYILGLIAYHTNNIDDKVYLKNLLETYLAYHKWAVVESLAETILEYGENRIALKALALSLEKQGRNKEAVPFLENLLKIDRFDADVAKKLAYALTDEDNVKAILYLKLAIEGYIKVGSYKELGDLWSRLVSLSWEDTQFFERIERLLVDAKQFELAAVLIKGLYLKYRDDENIDQAIVLLKKVLTYAPDDSSARKELGKFYEKKIWGTLPVWTVF